MKQDILEQLVDDYLQERGYFTRHNLRFRPDKNHPDFEMRADRSHSDIDVVGFHPSLRGAAQTLAVSCKSWQGGFSPRNAIACIERDKKLAGKLAWKHFRELTVPKWSEAFVASVRELTGRRRFTYVTAVTKLTGAEEAISEWESYPRFRRALEGNPLQLLPLSKLLAELYPGAGAELAVASSQVGRLLQVVRASGWQPPR